MKKVIIETEKTSKPIGPFSKAIKIISPKTLIFVSGHTARTKDGNLIKGDIKAQTKQIFENLKNVLEAGGATLTDVVKMTTFLKNMEDYSGYNEIRRQYFESNFPASSTFAVKQLADDNMLVEIEIIAAL
jgi:2-iminobutanoate/2-iminopropanoate deaminase